MTNPKNLPAGDGHRGGAADFAQQTNHFGGIGVGFGQRASMTRESGDGIGRGRN